MESIEVWNFVICDLFVICLPRVVGLYGETTSFACIQSLLAQGDLEFPGSAGQRFPLYAFNIPQSGIRNRIPLRLSVSARDLVFSFSLDTEPALSELYALRSRKPD